MGSFKTAPGKFDQYAVPANGSSYKADNVAELKPAGVTLTKSQANCVNELIRGLPATTLRKLGGYARRVTFSGDEYVYRPDDDVDWIYFPETTVFSELEILEDGRTIEVSMTGSEGAVGLTGIYFPARSSTWVQACAPGTALRVMSQPLNRLLKGNDNAVSLFHKAIAAHVRQMSIKVACSAHHSVKQRFSTWLLMLHDRVASGKLRLTQEQCARVLGVYRPSVTCIAQELRKDGLIDYVRGYIMIRDRDELRRQCCQCYFDLSSNRAQRVVRAFPQKIDRASPAVPSLSARGLLEYVEGTNQSDAT